MGEICHFLLLRQNSAKLFLDFCRRDIFHNISWLAIQNLTQAHYGINSNASVVHQAVDSLWVNLISISQIYLSYPMGLHQIKQFFVRNRHLQTSLDCTFYYTHAARKSQANMYQKVYK